MENHITKAVFCRRAINLQEIKERSEYRKDSASSFQVNKVIELTLTEFQEFGKELGTYRRFLFDFRDSMFYVPKKQCYQCLLVTTKEKKEGVLVEAEGYAYARLCAYVSDCSRLDLKEADVVKGASLSSKIPDTYWKQARIMKPAEER